MCRYQVLQTLTSLPLKTELEAGYDIFDQKPQPGSKKHLSQKQRKQRKKDKELEKELQHAAAEQSMEEKKRMVRSLINLNLHGDGSET
jgi:hypothetical protein